jgi:hypothetical protein
MQLFSTWGLMVIFVVALQVVLKCARAGVVVLAEKQ